MYLGLTCYKNVEGNLDINIFFFLQILDSSVYDVSTKSYLLFILLLFIVLSLLSSIIRLYSCLNYWLILLCKEL